MILQHTYHPYNISHGSERGDVYNSQQIPVSFAESSKSWESVKMSVLRARAITPKIEILGVRTS